MIDKRFWSGAIAIVTLIVAGAGALPELLLRPAPTGSTVVQPLMTPKAAPVAKFEQTKFEQAAALEQPAPVVHTASVPSVNRAETIAPPEPSTAEPAPQAVAAAPEAPKPEPEVLATSVPGPPVAFPPVQPVGVAAASAPDVVPPAAPQATSANPVRPKRTAEDAGQRPVKPRQNVRPAAYPMAEFLAWRR